MLDLQLADCSIVSDGLKGHIDLTHADQAIMPDLSFLELRR